MSQISIIVSAYHNEAFLLTCTECGPNQAFADRKDNFFTLRVYYEARIFVTQPTPLYRYIMCEKNITAHHPEYAAKCKKDALSLAGNVMLFCEEKRLERDRTYHCASFPPAQRHEQRKSPRLYYYTELERYSRSIPAALRSKPQGVSC